MLELRTAYTAELGDGCAAAIRELLDGAFGKVSEDTYQNVPGGVHALLVEDGALWSASFRGRAGRGSGRA